MDLSVAEAAARLNVDRSRVEQLLRAGRLVGRRSGRLWLVDADVLAALAAHPRSAGRPMAPARAWGLLDLLDGRSAPWLSSVARSQVRSRVRALAQAGPDQWRALLRARSEVLGVRVHPAVLARAQAGGGAWLPAGAARAAQAGADLVVLDPVVEVYVPADQWPALERTWHARSVAVEPNLLVHVPRDVWPFEANNVVGPAALAADLLDSSEPRAVLAGAGLLCAAARDCA